MRSLRGFILALPVLTACADGGTTSRRQRARTNGPSPSVAVTSAACGDVIVSDLRLENDLVCAGDGLTVSATGVRINLHGHTISGNGTGVGIRVNASQDVSIQDGTIRGFLQGMFVASSTEIVIKNNESPRTRPRSSCRRRAATRSRRTWRGKIPFGHSCSART